MIGKRNGNLKEVRILLLLFFVSVFVFGPFISLLVCFCYNMVYVIDVLVA